MNLQLVRTVLAGMVLQSILVGPAFAEKPRSEIVNLIIRQSLVSHSGNCPCPYNTDRAGRQCGQRSAFSRPGAAAPICYPEQVSDRMIDQFCAAYFPACE